jgi:hypothetical protein
VWWLREKEEPQVTSPESPRYARIARNIVAIVHAPVL